MKKKYIFAGLLICTACLVLILRIRYVNENARMPKLNQAEQGESVFYRGLEYRVVHAGLWEYADFFEEHEELKEYEDDIDGERKLLLVEYQVKVEKEENVLETDMLLQYGKLFNGMNPWMLADMNIALSEGTFRSGDTIVVPFEIYRVNLTEEQWEEVENLTMVYRTVLGTFPERNELLITEVQRMTPEEK